MHTIRGCVEFGLDDLMKKKLKTDDKYEYNLPLFNKSVLIRLTNKLNSIFIDDKINSI